MQNLQAYLMFDGNCEEAIAFYKEHLNGEVTYMGKYKDSPIEVKAGQEDKVMHLSFRFWGGQFMASDNVEAADYTTKPEGSNIHLSLGFTDKEKQKIVFDKMSAGGQIFMPLQDTFWGDHFGQFKDKFGVIWMFSFVNGSE